MVITLLGVILLAGLVFYVMNLGWQTQHRIEVQHAADATAAAGAGWIARSFNTVAMNNVGIARMIALVNVMDAMPQATAFSHDDMLAIAEAVDGQLNRGVNGSWVEDGLKRFRGEVQKEIDLLGPMDHFFNESGYDVRRMTFYNPPSGSDHGDIWRAMIAMDEQSQAAMETLGVLAQVNAVDGGETNLERSEQRSTAFLVPLLPGVPWVRGRFDDFERPVRQGLLPKDIDDKITNRGPYDVLFGWRDPVRGETEGHGVGDSDVAGGGKPNVPIGRGADRDNYVVTSRKPEAYRVYGPLGWMFRALANLAWPHLPHSRFAHYDRAPHSMYWVNHLARIKLDYLWPGTDPVNIVAPKWNTSLINAVGVAGSDPSKIKETAFVVIEIKSVYPKGHPQFLSPGSWTYVYEEEPIYRPSPRIAWVRGWVDPREWGVPQVADYIWRDEWSYTVFFDKDLGIGPLPGEDGALVPQPVYRIDDYMFAGINTGDEEPVRNPHNFGSKSDLPAPINFDHTVVTHEQMVRRQYLTFLAVAHQDNHSMFWPTRFDNGRPFRGNVAIAQVTVFNNHSWDLWTQMWHAQVQAVDDYDEWLARLQTSQADVNPIPALDTEMIDQLDQYLRSIRTLVPVMLSH